MSGENHEGNKSPDICDGNQRRLLCSRAMKHEAMKKKKNSILKLPTKE
jgi:hypothetical protein